MSLQEAALSFIQFLKILPKLISVLGQIQICKDRTTTTTSYSISMATSIHILQVQQLPVSPLAKRKLLKAFHTVTFGQK